MNPNFVSSSQNTSPSSQLPVHGQDDLDIDIALYLCLCLCLCLCLGHGLYIVLGDDLVLVLVLVPDLVPDPVCGCVSAPQEPSRDSSDLNEISTSTSTSTAIST